MSVIPTKHERLLQFYLSAPQPCPYLTDRLERKLFTVLPPHPDDAIAVNHTLTEAGFRRSHNIVYRPACDTCRACTPIRVPIANFAPSRTQKRIFTRNRDLYLRIVPPAPSTEHYALFIEYQNARHRDGEMGGMSFHDFTAMLCEGTVDTHIHELRNADGTLMGAMIVDYVRDCYSAVYSFYKPNDGLRSLGTALILNLITEAGKNDLDYVYLGYWIAASPKMAYKARFGPFEILAPHGWQTATTDNPLDE